MAHDCLHLTAIHTKGHEGAMQTALHSASKGHPCSSAMQTNMACAFKYLLVRFQITSCCA